MILNGCKEDEATSKKELIANDWKLQSITIEPKIVILGTDFSDMMADLEDCDKDEVYSFDVDGVFAYDAGEICDDSDDSDATGTWALNADETELTTVIDGETDVMKVQEISKSKMVMYVTFSAAELELLFGMELGLASEYKLVTTFVPAN